MKRHVEGRPMKTLVLASLLLAIAVTDAGCGPKCDNKCASSLTMKVEWGPSGGPGWQVEVFRDANHTEESDFLVSKFGTGVTPLGNLPPTLGGAPLVGFLAADVKKSTRVADGRLLLELFDARVHTAKPVVVETSYWDVAPSVPVLITAAQFDTLGGNKRSPLFTTPEEFVTASRRYLACGAVTMKVTDAGKTELVAKLRNTSDLAQYIDPAAITRGGPLKIVATGITTGYGEAGVAERLNFAPWGAQTLRIEVVRTPAELADESFLFLGYRLDIDFLGCTLPTSGSIDDLLASRSTPGTFTGFVFNALPGADSRVAGNWCWTDDEEAKPKFVATNVGSLDPIKACPTD